MDAGSILAHLVAWLISPFAGFTQPGEKMFGLHVFGSFLVALLVCLHAGEKNPFRTVFSRAVWGHRSALVDVRWYFVNGMLSAAVLIPLLALQRSNSAWIGAQLTGLLGARPATPPALWVGALVAISAALVSDLAIWVPHYLQHRVPLLWQFHKVHHSAEVLTPFTAYRFHPVDDLLNVLCIGVIAGTFDGVLLWLFPVEVVQFTILDVNAVLFTFYLLGVHLRHSHVWLAYPPALSRVFISPAMHQIHHSTRREHYDKNFGLVFSVWDWLFGTLHVAGDRLELTYGLGEGEEKEFSSVRRLYVLPFQKAAALLRRGR